MKLIGKFCWYWVNNVGLYGDEEAKKKEKKIDS